MAFTVDPSRYCVPEALAAGEAVRHDRPLQLVYVSSRQAIDPGVSVPGYAIANWAVLQLPKVLAVNLGKSGQRRRDGTACRNRTAPHRSPRPVTVIP